MSMFSKVGNVLHDQLMTGAAYSAASHMSTGTTIGAGLGLGSALYNGDPVIGGTLSGAATGAMLGGVSRYSSMKYAQGVANHILNTTVPVTGAPLDSKVAISTLSDVSNFRFGHFTQQNNNNVHANFWAPDSPAKKGERMMSQIDYQLYDPRFTLTK